MGTQTRRRKRDDSAGAVEARAAEPPAAASRAAGSRVSVAQKDWLRRGLDQPGGKLPLFDRDGQRMHPRTIRACMDRGWAEAWFDNPLKPDWLVCKLTAAGRRIASGD